MFLDIRLFINDKKEEFSFFVKDHLLFINCNVHVNKESVLHISFDENIYTFLSLATYAIEKQKAGTLEILLEKGCQTVSFSIEVNYKFMVKTVYKFVNELIDVPLFIQEIEFFLSVYQEEKEKKEIEKLLLTIKKIYETTGKERGWALIYEQIVEHPVYKNFAKKMNSLDLLLLITSYISVRNVPAISQEDFDELVTEAKNYPHALENVWRLAMNYDHYGFSYACVDAFFLEQKDAWYFIEYLSGVGQVNQEKIIEQVLFLKDTSFIKELLNKCIDAYIPLELGEKLKESIQ